MCWYSLVILGKDKRERKEMRDKEVWIVNLKIREGHLFQKYNDFGDGLRHCMYCISRPRAWFNRTES
jgi:hypothetical protein